MTKPRALVDNAADPEQVANAERVTKDAAKEVMEALERMANTRDGEIFFRSFVEETGLFRTSFSSDPLEFAKNEGWKMRGVQIIERWLTARPDAYAHLIAQYALKEKRTA